MPPYDAFALIAARNGGVVSSTEALGAGISKHHLSDWARCGRIARIARGVYVVGPVDLDAPDPRVVTSCLKVVLSHESAVAWLGADLPAPPEAVHVTAPRNRGRRADAVAGVRIHRAAVTGEDLLWVRGLLVTTPLRTALDIARSRPVEVAVPIIDAMLRRQLLPAEAFAAAAARATGRGRQHIALVASLVDATAMSILESLTRVLLWQHGLAPTETQYSIGSPRTGWIGYVDFAWPDQRVVLECDGFAFHADRVAFQQDRRRWSALVRAGWRPAIVTWQDVTRDPEYVVALVTDLLGPTSAPAPAIPAAA